MSVWNAVLLGLIHGIAEFLPISSTGHLAVINNLFKLSDLSQGHAFYQALLHLATIISVCIVYWPELAAMYGETLALAGLGPLAGQERTQYPAARCLFMIALSALPLLLALPINNRIETLYGRNIFIGIMLIFSGCLLYVSDRMTPGRKTNRTMTVSDALIIGLCQSVATIPGLSRAGVTITAGVATGLKPTFAVTFSFLMSLPALLGATILSLGDAVRGGIDWSSVPAYLVGMTVALLSGIAAIHVLRYISRKGKFGGFSYYCWVVGVMSIILHLIF